MNELSVITPDRIRSQRQATFNPIANLTPSSLASQIAAFKGGYLSGLAYTFEALQERDYSLQTDATKRYKAVARNPWEVVILAGHQDNPEAQRHKAALEFFYNNVRCTDAMEPHARGGAAMLFRTMARAIGHRYQPHEIIWSPNDPEWVNGGTGERAQSPTRPLATSPAPSLRAGLTATFTAVPLYFFEGRTGPLRFIREPYGLDGIEMPVGEWLVTVGDGLLLASAICWMFKQLALKDWVSYNGKFGIPGIHGKTDAAKDSPEWNSFVEAVENFANDWYAVTNQSGVIELLKADGGATLPMRELVLKMEEAITKMWRGGDLASQSSGTSGAVGAQGQNAERDMLEADDCELISETLNAQVDPHVIRWYFGEDVEPLAYFRLAKPKQQNAEIELKVDEGLTRLGVLQSKEAVAERYGRTIAEDGEEAVSGLPAVAGQPSAVSPDPSADVGAVFRPRPAVSQSAANATSRSFPADSRKLIADSFASDLAPVRARLETILAIDDESAFRSELAAIQKELPTLLPKNSQAAEALEKIIGTAMLEGLTEKAKVGANFNENHDPDNGQFAEGDGGSSGTGGHEDSGSDETDPQSSVGKTGTWKSLNLPDVQHMTPDKAKDPLTVKQATEKLKAGFTVTTVMNDDAQFGPGVLQHWKDKAKSPADVETRLKNLDRAEAALKTPHEVWENPRTGTRTFLHVVRDDKKTRVLDVFELKNGEIESYVSVSKLRTKGNDFRQGRLVYAR